RKLEHFGIKLEDSDKQQPSDKETENVKLQKDYEDFKMKGLAIEEGDQEDNTSTSCDDFFIIT
nr:hypothetical protein [Tanacetum cinerariifolium]